MKKMSKKILAFMLAAVMVIGAVPLSGLVGLDLPDFADIFGIKAEAATSGTCGDNLTWKFDESSGSLIISGTGAMTDFSYSSMPWNAYISYIKTVEIEKNVTSIGSYAFYKCTNLIQINIPRGVTSIGSYAFYCCGFSSIEIPESVSVIGQGAFRECKNLTGIVIPNNVKTIESWTFNDCDSLEEAVIGDNTTHIDYQAFCNCDVLKSVVFPKSLVYIGMSAFENCNKLSSVKYKGSGTEWNTISIGLRNDDLYNGAIYFDYLAPDDKEENYKDGINVFSSAGSLSIFKGEKSKYAICVYEKGELKQDLSSLVFINETPEIFSLSKNTETENGFCYITVSTKECGVGFLQIIDTYSGENVRIAIPVIKPKANSYTIYNVPELAEHGEHTLNFLYFNGISIDDFNFKKHNSGACTISFNVFNKLPIYAIVTVHDSNGKISSSQLIDKHIQFSESVYSGLIEEPIKLIGDMVSGDILSYRQLAGYSTETKVSVLVPEGGYIKITNNMTSSALLETINCIDAFIRFKSYFDDSIDLSKWDSNSYRIFKDSLNELLKKTGDSHMQTFEKNTYIDLLKKLTFTSKDLTECADSLSEKVLSFDADILAIVTLNAGKEVINIGEEIFTNFAGPAGKVLESAFVYNKYWNIYEQLYYMGAASNAGAISVRNPNETTNIMTYDDVTVINPDGFDAETSLETFKLSVDDALSRELKEHVLNSSVIQEICQSSKLSTSKFFDEAPHAFYDITFIKNGDKYQPGTEVVVYLTIPEEIKSEINWINRLNVYRVEEDGSLTKMNSKYNSDNDMISFTTDHFSLYLVVLNDLFSIVINKPSTTTVSYGDSIILHAEFTGELPAGAVIEWSTDNGNFEKVAANDGMTCKITPKSNGDTTVTMKVISAEGDVIAEDTQVMTSKAGFFDKIIGFFKKLFGLTKTIPQYFKSIF